MLSPDQIKQVVAREAASLVQDNTVIGIGTGSTIAHFIPALAQRVQTGLHCIAVPTSVQTQLLASQHGIQTAALNDVPFIDLSIDGADEIDNNLQLIKGGGGALLQEKMVAAACRERIIIADNSKLKAQLGTFPLPVEIVPYGWKQVQRQAEHLYNIQAILRVKDGQPFLTDHGHYILDCHFRGIKDPAGLNSALHLIPGVVETGLFVNMCEKAIIGYPDGSTRHITRQNGS
jgi:ribose 5-phosphate isomerase A